MIIDLREKYDVTPEWFEEKVKAALSIADATVIEKLALPKLCQLLSVYRTKDKAGAREAAARMKVLIDSPLIDEAME